MPRCLQTYNKLHWFALNCKVQFFIVFHTSYFHKMNSVALISTSLAKSARETVILRKQCISYMFYVVVYSLILKVQELYCTYTGWVALQERAIQHGLHWTMQGFIGDWGWKWWVCIDLKKKALRLFLGDHAIQEEYNFRNKSLDNSTTIGPK